MPDVVARPVDSRRARKDFLLFPWRLYRGDSNWVPPLRRNQEELTGFRPHPFYERNQIQTFLAYRGTDVCGRIAAIINQGHNERFQEQRGFFGFFDCVDDQQVADRLFDAARAWLTERGLPAMRGPTNPSMNYELGVLVEGFNSPPTFMMTYNPPYYPRLIESYGFRKSQDLYAYEGHIDMLPRVASKLGPIAKQIKEHCNLTVRPMNRARFREDVETFLQIYNRSLISTWGFVPMSPGEIQHMAKGLTYLILPELALAAEREGNVVGAIFALPDYNPRIRAIDGRLFPFGVFHLLRKKQQIKRLRIIAANVLPEYQLSGVGLVLAAAIVPKALEWGVEEAEFSWVLESNELSRGSLEKGGAKRTKTYRLYDLDP